MGQKSVEKANLISISTAVQVSTSTTIFEDYNEITDNCNVKINDGTYLEIHGIGTIKLNIWNGPEQISTKISGVLVCTGFKD